jgi:succinyl-diaminopimelate desuccinylase
MDLEAVLEKIDGSRADIVKEMVDMIRIPAIAPVNGGRGEGERADHLVSRLQGYDSIERIDVPDDTDPSVTRPNILARKNGKEEGTVWIVAHMDTVPVGDLDDWESPPFEPRIENGRIYGRGTEDNGQAVISSMFASKFIEGKDLKKRSIGIAYVADEETTSAMGIAYLLDRGYFSEKDVFIVPDWGSPGGKHIEVAEKNLIWLNFEVSGRSTHGSTPDKGVNALRASSHLIVELEKEFAKEFPGCDPMFMPPRSTFEPTRSIATVENVNTVPGYHEFSMDIRLLPEYDMDDVVITARRAASCISEKYGADISVVEIQRHRSGRQSSTEDPAYLALRDSVKYVTGSEPTSVGVGGATCANFFRAKGYNAYVWETGGGTLHTPNEYVVIEDIVTDAKVFATLFYKLCV